MSTTKFAGIMPPMSTFFDAEGTFDRKATATLMDRLMEAGVQGVLIGASCVVLAVPVAVLVFRHRQIASLVAREREGAARNR